MIRSVLSAPMSSRTIEPFRSPPWTLAARLDLGRRPVGRAALDLVERDEVVEGDRAHLDDVDLDPGDLERQDRPVDLVALHREQADLGHREVRRPSLLVAADLLVGPDDLFEREGDLLPGLELDDVGDPLLLDRRQLDELDQARLARHGDRDLAALQVVAVEERRQRLADELVGVGVGLAEDLGVFDEVERLGDDLVGVSPGTSFSAFSAAWPMSSAQTAWIFAMPGEPPGLAPPAALTRG